MHGSRPTTADSVQTSDAFRSVANTFRAGRNFKFFTGMAFESLGTSGLPSGDAECPPATGEGHW
jgi:hypothetical protein